MSVPVHELLHRLRAFSRERKAKHLSAVSVDLVIAVVDAIEAQPQLSPEQARILFDSQTEQFKNRARILELTDEAANVAGREVRKGLLLIHGGAVAAILALVGNDGVFQNAIMREGVLHAAYFFAAGLTLAAGAAGFVYFAHIAQPEALTTMGPVSIAHGRNAYRWNLASVGATVLSFLTFGAGVVRAVAALTT